MIAARSLSSIDNRLIVGILVPVKMADNWDVIVDQSGWGARKIYYNKLTGQSTLDKPDHLKTLGELQRVSEGTEGPHL